MPSIHPDAADGFAAGADAYERSRPSYPPQAVEHVVTSFGIGPGATVLDLGAGTGKWARLLLATGARVVAIEPVAEMRSHLAGVAGVEVLEGMAEHLPLPAASCDVVTAAQAFHWFEAPTALAEIARVLRPGGGLALVWNVRDESVPWVAELSRIVGWDRFARGHYSERDWASVVAAGGQFSPLERVTFPYVQQVDHDTLVDRMASISYVAALPAAEQAPILDQVRALVAGFPPEVDLPYRTEVWTAHRLPAG